MPVLPRLTSLWRNLFRKARVERDLDEELRSYVELLAAEKVRAGMSETEARRAALVETEGVEQVKERVREARAGALLAGILQDLRFALRGMCKSPAFTIFAVAALALGVAGNSAVFSVADAVLLRPLPYHNPSRLMMVWKDDSAFGFPRNNVSPGDFSDWKARNEVFEDMAAMFFDSFNLTGEGHPEELQGKVATANFFSVLGVDPVLGRSFHPDDDLPGAPRVVLLTHACWMQRFAADAHIAGKEIRLNNATYSIVGVLPPGFEFLYRDTDLWVPAQFDSKALADRDKHFLHVVARLKAGVTPAAANANLAAVARQIQKERPEEKGSAVLVPLREQIAGDTRPAILVLVAAVGFVLLIACANLATLLLARGTARGREMAIRLALGARRGRIVRQMLTESTLFALLAGMAGLGLAVWGTRFLARLIPDGIAAGATNLNGRLLAFCLAVSVLTGIAFGILPALRTSQVDLLRSLKQAGARAGTSARARRLRDILVVSEVALAVVLLAGAALMLRSFQKLGRVDPGFRADHVLVMRTTLPRPKYAEAAKRSAFYDAVLDRVSRVPGVIATGYTTWVPLTNIGGGAMVSLDNDTPPSGQRLIPNVRVISPGYLRALGMKLMSGRTFGVGDGADTQKVALINQTMARKFWLGEDPLGQRLELGLGNPQGPWITVAGVVGDVHQGGLETAPRPELYLLYQQSGSGQGRPGLFSPEYLAVRTSGDPMSLANAVRRQVWAVDNEQPVSEVTPLAQLLDDSVAPRRVQTSLLGGFAAMALLLAALGIYAVLSFAVTQRTQEIGVRVALGAKRRDVLRTVLTQGAVLLALGAAIGLAAALALSRLMAHVLYGISATDPMSFAGAALVLAGASLLACLLPALRATRVNPLIALRYE